MEQAGLRAGQAIARLGAEALPPTLPHFTVWYSYYGGQVPELTRTIDAMAAKPVTPALMDVLWQRFFGFEREPEVVRDTGERIQGALAQLVSMLRQFSTRPDTAELELLHSLIERAGRNRVVADEDAGAFDG